MGRHLVDLGVVVAGGEELTHDHRNEIVQAVVLGHVDDFVLAGVILDDLLADLAVAGHHHHFGFQLGIDPLQGRDGVLAVLGQVSADFRNLQDGGNRNLVAVRNGGQDGLEVADVVRGDGGVLQAQVGEVADLAFIDLAGPQVGVLGQGFRIQQAFLVHLVEPFHAGTPAGLGAGELHLVVFIDEVVLLVFRNAEGSEEVQDAFGAGLAGGSGHRELKAVRLHLAQHFGHFVNGLGGFEAQLVQFGLVYVPGAVVVDVLRHQVADVVGLAVGGGDGVAGVVQVHAGNIVGHDFFRQVLIQGQQQALVHAELFHVHRMADDHVGHVVRVSEHQVGLGRPVGILDHVKGNVGVGLLFDLLEVPEVVVEVAVLVFQRILEGGQLDLVIGQSGADAHHEAQREKQGNDFLHGVFLLFILRDSALNYAFYHPLRLPIMTPLTKYFCMKT